MKLILAILMAVSGFANAQGQIVESVKLEPNQYGFRPRMMPADILTTCPILYNKKYLANFVVYHTGIGTGVHDEGILYLALKKNDADQFDTAANFSIGPINSIVSCGQEPKTWYYEITYKILNFNTDQLETKKLRINVYKAWMDIEAHNNVEKELDASGFGRRNILTTIDVDGL